MISNILNLFGLVVAMIGSAILYRNSPSLFELDQNGDTMPADPGDVNRQKRMSKRGFYLVSLGFAFQALGTISSFCPLFSK